MSLSRATNHRTKSLPTIYEGIEYRSRLEARWAVVFTLLGTKFEYEPRTFWTREGGYVPDFRLLLKKPRWLEIKGPEPIERDYVRAAEVVRQSKEKLCFLVGDLPRPLTYGQLHTRVLSAKGKWHLGVWQTPWQAEALDEAIREGWAHRFDDVL